MARRLICPSHCPKVHLSSCLPSASSTAYQNQFTGLVQFWSALSCSVLVIHSSGFYPGEGLPLESLGSSLSLPLLSLLQQAPPPTHCLPDLARLSFIASVSQLPISRLILGTAYQPSPALYSALLCSAIPSSAAAVPNVACARPNCTSQPATGATREESHFGRLAKLSDRRRGRIALQIGTVSEASPHPPSPGYPITQPSQPAIIPPPKGPV